MAAAAAAGGGAATGQHGDDDDDDDGLPASPLDAALDALGARQAAARSRGLAALAALLRSGYRPDAADRPVSIVAALKGVLGKRGGSGADNATAATCTALALLAAGPCADAASAYESIAPTLLTMAGSVKGGGPPSARAAAATALAVGAFVVGLDDPGGPEVLDAVDALAGAAASRVVTGEAASSGVLGGTGGGGGATSDAPTAVAAAALRGLALLATVSWPSQAAALAGDGRLGRALAGALSANDVDVRHAAGLAAVALRMASGKAAGRHGDDGEGSAPSSSDEGEGGGGGGGGGRGAPARLNPALARVRGLASSSYAAGLDRLGGGGGGDAAAGGSCSGAATPTGAGGFRCGKGLRLSRAARTEQRRLFRGLEAMGSGGSGAGSIADVRAAVLRRVAGPHVVGETPWLADMFGGGGVGRSRAAWDGGGGGGRAGRGAKEKGRASAACEAVRLLAGDEDSGGMW